MYALDHPCMYDSARLHAGTIDTYCPMGAMYHLIEHELDAVIVLGNILPALGAAGGISQEKK